LKIQKIYMRIYRECKKKKVAQKLMRQYYTLSRKDFLKEAILKGYDPIEKGVSKVIKAEEYKTWVTTGFIPVSYRELLRRMGLPNKSFVYVIESDFLTQKVYNEKFPLERKEMPDSVVVETRVKIPKSWDIFLSIES